MGHGFATYLDQYILDAAAKEVLCEGTEQRVLMWRNLSKARDGAHPGVKVHSAVAAMRDDARRWLRAEERRAEHPGPRCPYPLSPAPRLTPAPAPPPPQRRRADRVDDDVSLTEAVETCHVRNGLECKMSCSSYKVSYVLDTEDWLVRRRKRRRLDAAAAARRRKEAARRFAAWNEAQNAPGALEAARARARAQTSADATSRIQGLMGAVKSMS